MKRQYESKGAKIETDSDNDKTLKLKDKALADNEKTLKLNNSALAEKDKLIDKMVKGIFMAPTNPQRPELNHRIRYHNVSLLQASQEVHL